MCVNRDHVRTQLLCQHQRGIRIARKHAFESRLLRNFYEAGTEALLAFDNQRNALDLSTWTAATMAGRRRLGVFERMDLCRW